jgi:hypothetical protein
MPAFSEAVASCGRKKLLLQPTACTQNLRPRRRSSRRKTPPSSQRSRRSAAHAAASRVHRRRLMRRHPILPSQLTEKRRATLSMRQRGVNSSFQQLPESPSKGRVGSAGKQGGSKLEGDVNTAELPKTTTDADTRHAPVRQSTFVSLEDTETPRCRLVRITRPHIFCPTAHHTHGPRARIARPQKRSRSRLLQRCNI